MKYKIKERNVVVQYNCKSSSNVIFTGKGSGYGTINITSEAWNSLKNLEIRNVGKVLIEGAATENARRSIIIASCDELRSSLATHWGRITVFESIKKVFVQTIKGEADSIVSFG